MLRYTYHEVNREAKAYCLALAYESSTKGICMVSVQVSLARKAVHWSALKLEVPLGTPGAILIPADS